MCPKQITTCLLTIYWMRYFNVKLEDILKNLETIALPIPKFLVDKQTYKHTKHIIYRRILVGNTTNKIKHNITHRYPNNASASNV